MESYNFNIADYRRDTEGLSIWAHGVYRLLLDEYYAQNGECLTTGLHFCALAGIHLQDYAEMGAALDVLDKYFERTETGWAHKRCDAEIVACEKERQEKEDARWLV